MKTETILQTKNVNKVNGYYEHTIKTDSLSINIQNNSKNNGEDLTYVQIKTNNKNSISINQIDNVLIVNGEIIELRK